MARVAPHAIAACAATLAVAILLASCASTLSRDELAVEYYNIGSAYFDLGELDKSATYLARAIELSPELARGSYNLARVYVLQERFDDALELLDELLDADPANALVIETIAYTYYQAGDLEAAAVAYERAAALNPSDPELLQNRAAVALAMGDEEGALEALRLALELLEDDPTLFLRLARAELAAGNDGAALDAYREYLDLEDAPQADALFEYAVLLESQEFYALAIDALELITGSATSTGADQAKAHFERGRLLLSAAEETESGVDAIRAAISLGFSDAEAYEELLSTEGLPARAELVELGADAGLVEDAEATGEGAAPGTPDGGGSEPEERLPVPHEDSQQ